MAEYEERDIYPLAGLAMMTGQAGKNGLMAIGEGRVPTLDTQFQENIKLIQLMYGHLSSMVQTVQRGQEYALEAIANELSVAGMPTATVFQEIAGFFHQNYARQRRAREKTVSVSHNISRGLLECFGYSGNKIPSGQENARLYATMAGVLNNAIQDLVVKTLGIAQATTQIKLQEIAAQAKGLKEAFDRNNQ